jgi:DNA (cytosine-5)-methyltransferase 1
MIGSLFDGIGGFPLAFLRTGVDTAWSAEIDPHCRSVTARHFSQVEQIEDVRDVAEGLVRPGIITAGWPCQGNSVAGKRGGMADERSGLWSEVRRILAEFRPRWFLGENVPGLLSVCGCIACRTVNAFLAIHSERNDGERCKCIRCDAGRRLLAAHRGRDFCGILADLAELGYGFAYRIFDAQWFGVAQRRRRVFIVGCLGDWRSSAEVLFESDSLPWHPAPIRESRPRVANYLTSGVASGSGVNRPGRRREDDFNLVTHTLRGEGFDASEDGTGRGTPLIPVGGSLGATKRDGVCHRGGVRRLTPRECERLQGFPDDWTRHGADGAEMSDSARYRMLGNSVAVPCVEWIARRLIERDIANGSPHPNAP